MLVDPKHQDPCTKLRLLAFIHYLMAGNLMQSLDYVLNISKIPQLHQVDDDVKRVASLQICRCLANTNLIIDFLVFVLHLRF